MTPGQIWVAIIIVVVLFRLARWLSEPDRADEHRRRTWQ